MSDFVHLHCHSEYSLLDGAIRLKDLCGKAKNLGMPACAITDHGNLYGALRFYMESKKVGIKPIIGCEVYVTPDHLDKTTEKARIRHHLVLLAQNRVGYHNLVKLVSTGHLHGFYMRPRVDKGLLRQYAEGIVCLSACIAGEIPQAIVRRDMGKALAVANEYAALYPGRFFLEIQANGLPEQSIANNGLLELAETTGLPLVATNDCHYLNADDYEAHDVLLCIQTQAKVMDEKRLRFGTKDLYYKTPEEMEADFGSTPEALANTARIAEMIGDYEFDFKTYHFPIYELPEGMTIEAEFRQLAREGLARRLARLPEVDQDAYRERLEYELNVICEMGFPGYFLIVQDFINWAKNNGVPVGPGRGSAAGSLVAFALRITNLDPIPYNLLFERFLNSERVSMPDIDVDFCEANRHKVIEYVGRKYGNASVSQITTFGTMKAKGVVRDVGRALGMTFQETDRIAKLIPAGPLKIDNKVAEVTLALALEHEADFRAAYGAEPEVKHLVDIAMRLEKLCRHASIHAAGLVISDRAMVEYLPVYRGKAEGEIVTQYDMKMVEKVGLVKFDFLGLRNMTVIENTLKNIAASGKEVPDLDFLPLNDPETYNLYSCGDTDGIFQVESSGMSQYLRMLRPTVFEDIIAMLALYRPGPLNSGMVDEFIKRKHGQVEVTYPLPSLEGCLKDTYGVIVYQEQVMQIAQIVAGYTLGGADLLRRAMGKKDPAAMAAERSKFVSGALERATEEAKANEIFDLMEKFAEYGFNKSHSAAYALISYHTAYLKTHYKAEFMAAVLSSEMGNQDKLLKYVAACKDMGIPVLSPDVQKSHWNFAVHGESIVFGLGGIKNVGFEPVRELVAARTAKGPFTSLLDLCSRVPMRKLTKRSLESLIKSGACDCFGVARAGLFAALDAVQTRAQKATKDREANLISLFSIAPELELPATPGIGFDCPEQKDPEWPDTLLAQYEKESLGFFFSNHPLQPYRREVLRMALAPLEDCRDLAPGSAVRVAVLVTSLKEIMTKKGEKMAFCQVEDLTASGECVFFPKDYADIKDLLQADEPLYLEARISENRQGDEARPEAVDEDEAMVREIKLIGEKVQELAKVCRGDTTPVQFEVNAAALSETALLGLKNVLGQFSGEVPVQLVVRDTDLWCKMELDSSLFVTPGPELDKAIRVWRDGA